tara:strand:- start:314 stop:448 length:135 start_codon:yes stop_codon:yes gene_type:complete
MLEEKELMELIEIAILLAEVLEAITVVEMEVVQTLLVAAVELPT